MHTHVLCFCLEHNAVINDKISLASYINFTFPTTASLLCQQSAYLNQKSLLGLGFPSVGKGSNLDCLEKKPRNNGVREPKRPE